MGFLLLLLFVVGLLLFVVDVVACWFVYVAVVVCCCGCCCWLTFISLIRFAGVRSAAHIYTSACSDLSAYSVPPVS